MKKTLLSLAVVALAFTACKKEETAKTAAEMLAGTTSYEWSLEKFILDGDDLTAEQDPCSADDFQRFYANFTVETDEGATKCDSLDPQVFDKGTWSLSNGDKTLTIVSDGESDVATITELTETNLKITGVIGEAPVEIHYKRK